MDRIQTLFLTGPLVVASLVATLGCSKQPTDLPPSKPQPGTSAPAAPAGRALCIGLNRVDPDKWGGWEGKLKGCLNDAKDMKQLLTDQGFAVTMLTDGQATVDEVLKKIGEIGGQCKAGDIFVITYSGHGGQVRDENGDEVDHADETWCLFDGHLIDDYLRGELAKVMSGVRVVVISDSCHSGTVIRMTPEEMTKLEPPIAKIDKEKALVADQLKGWSEHVQNAKDAEPKPPSNRGIPVEAAWKALQARGDEYVKRGKEAPTKERQQAKASIVLLSGCQDWETSADGSKNGLFTQTLLEVWKKGSFKGFYPEFHSAIATETNERRQRMYPFDETQKPNMESDGAPDDQFPRQQAPFTIVPKH